MCVSEHRSMNKRMEKPPNHFPLFPAHLNIYLFMQGCRPIREATKQGFTDTR